MILRYFPVVLIIALEIIALFYVDSITEVLDINFSLKARYSARISFATLTIIGIWMAAIGLKNIFANDKKRQLFIGGILAFTINHLIHYWYLYQNFEANGLDISSKYISFGALSYLILTFVPILIWKWNQLTKSRYYMLSGFIVLMISICLYTYSSRFESNLPLPPPSWLFSIFIGIGGIVILGILGRIWKDKNLVFDEMA